MIITYFVVFWPLLAKLVLTLRVFDYFDVNWFVPWCFWVLFVVTSLWCVTISVTVGISPAMCVVGIGGLNRSSAAR